MYFMIYRYSITLSLFLLFIFLSGCCCCCSPDLFSQDNGELSPTPANSSGEFSKNHSDNRKILKSIIVICDDYIDPENNAIAEGMHANSAIIKKFLGKLERRNLLEVEKIVLQGKKASTANIIAAIKDIDTDSDDILFFYYCGHGGMTGGNTYLWPCDENALFRKDLLSLVGKKDATLKLVFTDACSSSIDSVGYRNMLNYMGNVSGEGNNDSIYRNLFLNYEGTLDLTAASEGQFGFSNDVNGGYFTSSLFDEVLLLSPLMTWDDVVSKTIEKTEEKFKHGYKMKLFSESTYKDLEERDITSQTPKYYSMPDIINKGEEQFIPTEEETEHTCEAMVKNETGKKITFYVDNNIDDKELWSYACCKKIILSSGESTELGNKGIIKVFYDKGNEEIDYYKLDTGRYYFGLDGDLIQLYIGKGADNQAGKSVIIYNFDYDDIDFFIKFNNGANKNYSLKPNGYVEITGDPVEIYYGKSSDTLDSGQTYYFMKNPYDEIRLYVSR